MINVAYLQLFSIDTSTGAVVDRNLSATTMDQVLNTRMESRVIIDPSNSNTAGNPTLTTYLTLEDKAGLKLVHLDQTLVITQS